MTTSKHHNTVEHMLFQPINGLVATSPNTRVCTEFSDDDFLRLGILRVIEASNSGRAFLQEHGLRFDNMPVLPNYFSALNSRRRRDVLRDLQIAIIRKADSRLTNRLADISELSQYDCFAMDGHWHKSAAHDPRHEGAKVSVGHFYSLNMRTHSLRHMTAAKGLHEHDMHALKRINPRGLRQQTPRGRRVLAVYDKAGIDFDYWKRCRKECAVYFLSRIKENMVYDWIESLPIDSKDPRNHGVTCDKIVMTRDDHKLRIICYEDPVSGNYFEFLTNVMDLPAAVLVELYRRRWEIEKVYDQIKNKLGEQKAWGSSLEAKESQALFVVLTHNLLMMYEQELEAERGIANKAENHRRSQRIENIVEHCRKKGKQISTLVVQARLATQRSVKFIRWLRQCLRLRLAEDPAVLDLQQSYASL